jgi:predicted RNase H-like HicB family nuclease
MAPKQLVFEISKEEDGTLVAVGVGDDIFTQGADMDELKVNIKEAVLAHFAGEDYHDFEVHLDKAVSQFAVFA